MMASYSCNQNADDNVHTFVKNEMWEYAWWMAISFLEHVSRNSGQTKWNYWPLLKSTKFPYFKSLEYHIYITIPKSIYYGGIAECFYKIEKENDFYGLYKHIYATTMLGKTITCFFLHYHKPTFLCHSFYVFYWFSKKEDSNMNSVE